MISSYMFVLRRRLFFIICSTALLAPLIFFLLQSRPAQYTSEAVIEVGTGDVAEQIIGQQRAYEAPERRVATEASAVTSRPVAALAAKRLAEASNGEDLLERVEARSRPGSDYIDVTGTGPTAQSAQRLTEALTAAYLEYRRDLQQNDLRQLEQDLVQQRRDAEAALQALPAGASAQRDRAVLTARVDNAVRLVEAVRLRLSLEQIGVELVSAASLPDGPSNTRAPGLAAATALLAAALAAIALAFGIDVVRDGLRTPAEAETLIGAPVIATVQRARHRSGRRAQSPSAARRVRLGLTSACGGSLPRRILVIGAYGEEEDSRDVAALLAISCRDIGVRALAVADTLGDPAPPPALLPAPDGASLALPGGLIVRESREAGVWCAAATAVGTDVGLFDAPAAGLLLEEAGRHFDAVVLLPEPDNGVEPRSVRHLVDAGLLVGSLGTTRVRKLKRMLSQFDRSIDAIVLIAQVSRMDDRSSAPPRDPAPQPARATPVPVTAAASSADDG